MGGQGEPEGTALSQRAVYAYMSTELLDDAFDDGEAKTMAFNGGVV